MSDNENDLNKPNDQEADGLNNDVTKPIEDWPPEKVNDELAKIKATESYVDDASEAIDLSEVPDVLEDEYIQKMGKKAEAKAVSNAIKEGKSESEAGAKGKEARETAEKELQERYESGKVSKDTFEASIDAYLIIEEVDRGISDEETEKTLSGRFGEASGEKSVEEINEVILDEVESKINMLFGVEGKNLNEEKRKALIEESEKYLNLLKQAQADGSLPEGLTSKDVYSLLEENVLLIAFQDKKASETSIGDHGVRHIIHNINECDNALDQLNGHNNGSVSAMDKIIARQAMIMHDMGYATDEVAGKDFSKDFGHNVLSAKIAMEHIVDPNSPIGKVFSKSTENGELIHSAILNHDSSDVRFDMSEKPTPEGRKQNIEAAVHLADNLHAFETKLPEVLYAYPGTLEALTLLEEASSLLIREGEDGRELTDEEMAFNREVIKRIVGINSELKNRITNDLDISPDDTKALLKSVDSIDESTGRYAVGRLLGKDPKTTINSDGSIEISVVESAIHRKAIGLIGVEKTEQFKKFIGDVSGNKLSDAEVAKIMGGKRFEAKGPPPFVISLRKETKPSVNETGENTSSQETKSGVEKSDLDEQMDKLLKNTPFKNHVRYVNRKMLIVNNTSNNEATKQSARQKALKSLDYYLEGEK